MSTPFPKPTKIPRWADTTSNILEPAEGKKTLGWVVGEEPASSWENWKSKLIGDWFKWIDERLADYEGSKNQFLIKYPEDATEALGFYQDEGVDFAVFGPNSSYGCVTFGDKGSFSWGPTYTDSLFFNNEFGLKVTATEANLYRSDTESRSLLKWTFGAAGATDTKLYLDEGTAPKCFFQLDRNCEETNPCVRLQGAGESCSLVFDATSMGRNEQGDQFEIFHDYGLLIFYSVKKSTGLYKEFFTLDGLEHALSLGLDLKILPSVDSNVSIGSDTCAIKDFYCDDIFEKSLVFGVFRLAADMETAGNIPLNITPSIVTVADGLEYSGNVIGIKRTDSKTHDVLLQLTFYINALVSDDSFYNFTVENVHSGLSGWTRTISEKYFMHNANEYFSFSTIINLDKATTGCFKVFMTKISGPGTCTVNHLNTYCVITQLGKFNLT